MSIERYESNGRFCQAVSYNGMLFVSGLVDIETSTFEEQTKGVFAKIDALLEKYGSSRAHLLNASVYLKSVENVAEFNALWLEWIIAGEEPTRTCIVTEMVHPAILVEISVVAAIVPHKR